MVVSCQYWEVRHSADCGGNIVSVVFPHGSGKNIFAAPFATQIQRGSAFGGDFYEDCFDHKPETTCYQNGELVRVSSRSHLLDRSGRSLPVVRDHTYTYWNETEVLVLLAKSIPMKPSA